MMDESRSTNDLVHWESFQFLQLSLSLCISLILVRIIWRFGCSSNGNRNCFKIVWIGLCVIFIGGIGYICRTIQQEYSSTIVHFIASQSEVSEDTKTLLSQNQIMFDQIEHLNQKIESLQLSQTHNLEVNKGYFDKIISLAQSPSPNQVKSVSIISDSRPSEMKKMKIENAKKKNVYQQTPNLIRVKEEYKEIALAKLKAAESFGVKFIGNEIIKVSTKYHHFEHLPTIGGVAGSDAFKWALTNAPFIDIPELPDIERVYYHRWKVLREHIIPTGCPGAPLVFTECRLATTPPPSKDVNHHHQPAPIDGSEGCIWGDDNGVIGAAEGHHIMEGRWLRDSNITDSYLRYLFHQDIKSGTTPSEHENIGTRTVRRVYSEWPIFATYQKYILDGNLEFVKDMLPLMLPDAKIMKEKYRADLCRSKSCKKSVPGVPQCYWIADRFDAMEASASGYGCRPSIQSIVFGEVTALAHLLQAVMNNNKDEMQNSTVQFLLNEAEQIKQNFIQTYWREDMDFFTVFKTVERCSNVESVTVETAKCDWEGKQFPCEKQVDVRELIGLGPPWMFGVIDSSNHPVYEKAWLKLLDEQRGFKGKYGLRTTEKGHRCYNWTGGGRCAWDGPSWPYETSRVLAAMGELLHIVPGGYRNKPYTDAQREQSGIKKSDFVELLNQYAQQHIVYRQVNELDEWDVQKSLLSENFHPDEGYWIDRSKAYDNSKHNPYNLMTNTQGVRVDRNRALDYFHSTFCDIVLGHLLGIRPQGDTALIISPLIDPKFVTKFAVDRLRIRNFELAIVYDVEGNHYYNSDETTPLCKGFCVFVDGALVNASLSLTPLHLKLPR